MNNTVSEIHCLFFNEKFSVTENITDQCQGVQQYAEQSAADEFIESNIRN